MLTIPDEATSQTYVVGASQSVFPFPFAVFAKADLHFKVGTTELLQSDFTLTGTLLDGGGMQGGTVTLNTPVAAVTCLLWRETVTARATNYAPAPSVPVRDLDVALNRLTAVAQDIKRDLAAGGSGVSAGVASVNGRAGVVGLTATDVTSGFGALMATNLVAGAGVTLVTAAGVTTVATTAGGVSSVAGRSGAVVLTAADVASGFGAAVGSVLVGGTNVIINTAAGVTTISATAGGGGVASVNTRTGAVTLTAADVASGFGAAVGATLTAGANISVVVAAGVSTIAATGLLLASNNFSDVASVGTARTNLGLGTSATHAATDFLQATNSLSDVASASLARTNIGLGTIATLSDLSTRLVAGAGITLSTVAGVTTITSSGGGVAYSTWNPADVSSAHVVLTGGNWIATDNDAGISNRIGVRGTLSLSSGKKYFEFKSGAASGGGEFIMLARGSMALNANAGQFANEGITFQAAGGVFASGASALANGWTSWDVATSYGQIAVDLTAKLLWVRVGTGNWNNSGAADPATAVGGISYTATGALFPMASLQNGGSGGVIDAISINTGGSSFLGTVPSGFTAWG